MGWEPISRTVGEGRAGAGEITGWVGARAGLMLQHSVVLGVGLSLWNHTGCWGQFSSPPSLGELQGAAASTG